MNPEIKKFYEKSYQLMGYKSSLCEWWCIMSDSDYYKQGGPPPPLKNDIIYLSTFVPDDKPYRINNSKYSEEEMLRIIRMKSFL